MHQISIPQEIFERNVRGVALFGQNQDVFGRGSWSDEFENFGEENASPSVVEAAPASDAVEVRSEGDYGPSAEHEMARKRGDYFAAGTLVVWDVDLLSADVVKVYFASEPKKPTIYRRGDIAEAEPAAPGWSMEIDDLFVN